MIIIKKFYIVFLGFFFLLGFDNSNPNKVIYIDPGHGGFDGGASNSGVDEKDISLEISLKLKDILEELGHTVLLTRDSDIDLSNSDDNKKRQDIRKRVKLINESNCDLYLSIHLNSGSNSSYRGFQSFYTNKNSNNEKIARYIQESVIKNLDNTKRKEMVIKNKYLTDNVNKPGCLLEVGFLSNDIERKLLLDKEYQEKLCFSIVSGIIKYFFEE